MTPTVELLLQNRLDTGEHNPSYRIRSLGYNLERKWSLPELRTGLVHLERVQRNSHAAKDVEKSVAIIVASQIQ